jgi:hypothetical protein
MLRLYIIHKIQLIGLMKTKQKFLNLLEMGVDCIWEHALGAMLKAEILLHLM